MKTPKEFYVVMDKDGRMWAGYNSFTTRPWQAKLYSVKEQAEKTARRCKAQGGRVVRAKITFEFLEG
ncbi:MAG: hypothetical protein IJX67_10905 [Oscillospiraceae bacterium]|nr:hypothetical protein [Oscillospiraceae bacterium]